MRSFHGMLLVPGRVSKPLSFPRWDRAAGVYGNVGTQVTRWIIFNRGSLSGACSLFQLHFPIWELLWSSYYSQPHFGRSRAWSGVGCWVKKAHTPPPACVSLPDSQQGQGRVCSPPSNILQMQWGFLKHISYHLLICLGKTGYGWGSEHVLQVCLLVSHKVSCKGQFL